jgi:hypothetical protein
MVGLGLLAEETHLAQHLLQIHYFENYVSQNGL